MAQDTMYAGKINSPATTLNGAINDSVTTINVVDGSVFPDAPNIAVIGTGEDAETILYDAKNANELSSVTRGFQGTAKAWDSGEAVARLFTAYDYDTLRENISDLEGRLGETNTASNIGSQVEIFKQKTGVDLEFRTLKAGSGIDLFNSEPIGKWDITNCSYDSLSKSVGSQDTAPYGLAFNSDGSKMYILGYANKTVYQYSLSTPWNVGTASYDSLSKSVGSQDTAPYGLAFNSDGSKMYIVGAKNDTVYQYSLSTPWNVGTASYDSVSFSVSSQETTPRGLAFNSDGSKMYIVGYANNTVYQYSLSTPWNVGTASYNSVSFSVSSQDTNSNGLAFNSDGSKMYIVGYTNKTVYQYSLSTPWNVSTASYDSVSKSVGSQDTVPYGLAFNSDGSKMYIVGAKNDTVYQYTVGGTIAYDYVQIKADPSVIKLSEFASTTSAELAGVISDETGSGALVFGTSPTLASPTITGELGGELDAGAHSIVFTEQVLTSAAAIAWDLTKSNKATLTAGHNFTITISPPSGALNAQVIITQDGTGSRVMDEIVTQSDTTIATTDVNTTTKIITIGIDIPTGARIRFKSTTTVPAGLTADTIYYAIRVSATQIKVATTKANAMAGTAIDLTSQGTGTHTVQQLAKWAGGTLGVLSTAAGAEDVLSLTYKTADKQWYAMLSKDFQ